MSGYRLLIEFIRENGDWEDVLARPPYSIRIKQGDKDGTYTWRLFKYPQTGSDFGYDVVRCCRGVVLDISGDEVHPVCVPFRKFFNYGEQYAADIDFSHPVSVTEKLDGSLIKLSKYNGEPHWFTNGSISTDVPVNETSSSSGGRRTTYRDLIDACVERYGIGQWVESIPEGVTYMFELTSDQAPVVLRYTGTELTLIGCYVHQGDDPDGWRELPPPEVHARETERDPAFANVPLPRQYECGSMRGCLDLLSGWGDDHEGVVICDLETFDRIKLKSDSYLKLKYSLDSAASSTRRVYDALRDGSADDLIAGNPELSAIADSLSERMTGIVGWLQAVYAEGRSYRGSVSSREFASMISDRPWKSILFEGFNGYQKTLSRLDRMDYGQWTRLCELKEAYDASGATHEP